MIRSTLATLAICASFLSCVSGLSAQETAKPERSITTCSQEYRARADKSVKDWGVFWPKCAARIKLQVLQAKVAGK